MIPRAIRLGLLIAGVSAICADRMYAQGLSVDVAAGRIVYDPIAAAIGTSNVTGTLRYDATRGTWVYMTGATPMHSGDPLWAAVGGGGRFTKSGTDSRPLFFGADVDAHGFLFRDRVALLTGNGGTIDAIPFAGIGAGSGRVELRGGWRGHTLDFASERINRGVFETGARASYGWQLRVQGDVKWVYATEGTYPFVGASVIYNGVPVQLWAQTGKWLSTDLGDATWGAGVAVPVGGRATLWGSARQDAPDPLYWNAVRRSWSVGLTTRFGARTPVPSAPRIEAGNVVIRVSAKDVRGDALFIAGDFNQWQPVPMQREGGAWTIRLPLPQGAYHYAFRSERGEWFVPSSIAGRRDDGMGGQVALLVVM
jgi:hypothetical protein